MFLQIEGLEGLKGTLEPKRHFSHHDLNQISRGGREQSAESQIISGGGQLRSTQISCSHQWSSCSLQRSSPESSCPQTHWPPNGASCFPLGHQEPCCRSPPCHSLPWNPQTPSWSHKKINNSDYASSTLININNRPSHGEAPAGERWGFYLIHYSYCSYGLTRIHRLLLNFAWCVFFQLHQCDSIPWNWEKTIEEVNREEEERQSC